MNQSRRLARFRAPFERIRLARENRLAKVTVGSTVTVNGEKQVNQAVGSRRRPAVFRITRS